ncbi:MAG TPA: YihY/virulence factor BrkB family protein [Abditibacteriaceae bacterium]|jgi:membrane protein
MAVETPLPAPLEWLETHAPLLHWPIRFGWRFFERWERDKCPLIAASLAFFGLLSVFPILLAAIALLSRFVADNPALLKQFRTFAASFFPGAAGDVLGEIDTIAQTSDPRTLGIAAIASLVWSGRAYFATLASVLNTIWPHAVARVWWKEQLMQFALLAGAGALWLCSTAATIGLQTAQRLAEPLMRRAPDAFLVRQPALWNFAGQIVAFFLTTLMFWLIYRFVPNVSTRRRRRLIWGAALWGSLAWEAAKWIFTDVISAQSARYRSTYGGVASVVLTLLWIYFSSMILLLGAEAAAVYEEMCGENKETRETAN